MIALTKVLYIEDDREIGSWVREDLERRGFDVCWLLSGDRASEYVQEMDVVVLDVMLPGLDGFTVGQRLKNISPQTPILMLSARTAVEDKLEGLRFADDYLTKPFHPDELAARLEVLLRRYEPTQTEIQLGHLRVKTEGTPDYRSQERGRNHLNGQATSNFHAVLETWESDFNQGTNLRVGVGRALYGRR